MPVKNKKLQECSAVHLSNSSQMVDAPRTARIQKHYRMSLPHDNAPSSTRAPTRNGGLLPETLISELVYT